MNQPDESLAAWRVSFMNDFYECVVIARAIQDAWAVVAIMWIGDAL